MNNRNIDMIENELKSFTLLEQNELMLCLKYNIKKTIKKANATKNVSAVPYDISRQLNNYEGKLMSEFKKKGLKYRKLDNSINYDYIKDKYPEVFI